MVGNPSPTRFWVQTGFCKYRRQFDHERLRADTRPEIPQHPALIHHRISEIWSRDADQLVFSAFRESWCADN
jgi:hypothetical protein